MQLDEQHRHRCEVRMLLRLRDKEGRKRAQEWIDAIEMRRGVGSTAAIRADCTEQWQAGNRGDVGDWRDAAEAKA